MARGPQGTLGDRVAGQQPPASGVEWCTRRAKGNDCAMDLHAVADELYGLLPEDFAATRKIRAGEAQAAGDRDLAAAIRQLRRPTTSAWLANLLVRERPTQIAQLLELGTAMHRAQADLVGEELRQLSQQRQEVVTSLSDAARQLAHDLGKHTSDATMRELEETLEAAIADSEARDALASGHLAAAMRYSGLGAECAASRPRRRRRTRGRRGERAAAAHPRRRPGGAADDAGPKKRQARSAVARAEREADRARSPTTEGHGRRRPVQPGHRGSGGSPALPARANGAARRRSC